MWIAPYNRMADDEAREHVATAGAAELVTVGSDGFPVSTRLPVLWAEGSPAGRLVFHMAYANPQWRDIATDGSPALAIFGGPEAYISPSYYASKPDDPRAVPTWNYSTVHVTGRVRVHHDPGWLLGAVTELTNVHERTRAEPWEVADAPAAYISQNLKAIVGLELTIVEIRAKAKRSQNRSTQDHRSITAALEESDVWQERAMAHQMTHDRAGDIGA
jgi:transcriptional regulator